MQTLVFKNKWQENKRNSVCRWVLEGRERAKGEGEGSKFDQGTLYAFMEI
jgi:hypothetical protein